MNKLRKIALNRPLDYVTSEGREKINEVRSKIIELFDLDNKYLCSFKSVVFANNYLKCSAKTLHRAIEKGYIYIPDSFKIYMNDDFINNNFDINKIKLEQNELIKTKSKSKNYRIKGEDPNLQAEEIFTKYIIK